MNAVCRIAMSVVMAGFFAATSGCIIAPPPDRGHDHDHERDVHEEHHCDDRDRDCRDR